MNVAITIQVICTIDIVKVYSDINEGRQKEDGVEKIHDNYTHKSC